MKTSTHKEVVSWIKSFVIVGVIVLIVRSFVLSPYEVEGASMEPTLHNHEKVIVNKTTSITDHFNRGDVVIIELDNLYVKRVIGFPGDVIEVKDDTLYINGKVVEEPYLYPFKENAHEKGIKLTGDFGPLEVPEDNYFVMGDNRLRSMDSRNGLGFIPKESIIGTSELVIYPFNEFRKVK